MTAKALLFIILIMPNGEPEWFVRGFTALTEELAYEKCLNFKEYIEKQNFIKDVWCEKYNKN